MIWVEITAYLQHFVPVSAVVLDIACDVGYFVRNVAARERWATDFRDVSASLPAGIHFVQSDGLALLDKVPREHFDVVFMSNYLEHLPDAGAVIAQLLVVYELLKPGGKVIVLQPNIRLTKERYWDFIDHRTALTEASLVEAAEVAGFECERLITRFLPYTTKSRYPLSAFLIRVYLRLPVLWRIFGQQTLLVAVRPR
jgi:SAM-dependent methyltransferase